MNTPVATSEPAHPVVQFKRDLDAALTDISSLDERSRQRLRNAAVVAITKDPELLGADRQSLFGALRMCAQHGVTPDGNEAVLSVYSTKVKIGGVEQWIKKVQYQPMIRGIVNRVLRSGRVAHFAAELVYAGEEFTLDLSHGDRRPVHAFNPLRRGKDGDILGAYAVAKLANGTVDCEVLTQDDIAKIRSVAKSQNVWERWFGEKAKVAAMRRLSKRLPLSAEDMDFIVNADEHDMDERDTGRVVAPRESTQERLRRAAAEREAMARVDVTDADVVVPHWTEAVAWDECTPGSKAFVEGVEAAKAGKAATDCPYAGDAAKAADWLGGWHGQKEAEK